MSQFQGPIDRDRVIADTGWGIKPDDQPANADEAGEQGCRTYHYDRKEPDVVRRMLVMQRRGFNTANRARIESGRTSIIDINGDAFVIEGLGYGDENFIVLLQCLGASFHPKTLRELGPDEATVREFALGRAWAWGEERSGG